MILWRPKHEVSERTKAICLDFARKYRDLGALREELFNEQSGICAICKKPLQSTDSIISVVDHAISKFLYATWDYSIEEACKHANARCNLLAVHALCNTAKSSWDYEEFMEQLESGSLSLESSPTPTFEEAERLRQKRYQNPEYKAAISKRVKEKWQDPTWRTTIIAIIQSRKKKNFTPEQRAALAARMRKLREDPDWQSKRAAGLEKSLEEKRQSKVTAAFEARRAAFEALLRVKQQAVLEAARKARLATKHKKARSREYERALEAQHKVAFRMYGINP